MPSVPSGPTLCGATHDTWNLADVWAAVLRREAVGVDDNFFELGGDSILSIQVIARCRQAGLHVTTRDLFKFPTVSALSAVVVPAVAPPAVQRRVIGDAPLTPNGRWFFEQGFGDWAHWNQAQLLQVPADLDLGALDAALAAVVAQHDIFRLRFRQGDGASGGWRSGYVPSNPPTSVERIDRASIRQMISTATSRRPPGAGRLTSRTARFSVPSTAHGHQRAARGHPPPHGGRGVLAGVPRGSRGARRRAGAIRARNRTTSFSSGRSVRPLREHKCQGWLAGLPPTDAGPILPCDHDADAALNTEGSTATAGSLTVAETDALFNERFRPEPGHDLLLSALARALQAWTGRPTLWWTLRARA
jgi:aryl carrier-like protein